MTYPYTELNQLETPSTYMYSRYGGQGFLTDYRQNRLAALARKGSGEAVSDPLDGAVLERWGGWLRDGQADLPFGLPLAGSADLAAFAVDARVETQPLLLGLIGRAQDPLLFKAWMARLVQRYEVTKKLYQAYGPGFRKGEGPFQDLRPYRLFALALVLGYRQTGHLPYLNALLKVDDLLLSVMTGFVDHCPASGLVDVLIRAELALVDRLQAEKGISHA